MKKAVCAGVVSASLLLLAQQTGLFSILKSNVLLGRQDSGAFLVPTNQLLRPWGEQALLKGRPVDMAFNTEKTVFAVLNSNGVSTWDAATGTQIGEVRSRGASTPALRSGPAAANCGPAKPRETAPTASSSSPFPIPERPGPSRGSRCPDTPFPPESDSLRTAQRPT
jgi:hypothetical protein